MLNQNRHAARSLIADSIVWDNHACMPLRLEDDFLPQLSRVKDSGFSVVALNIGFGEMYAEQHLKQLAYFRHWIKAHSDHYMMVGSAADIETAKQHGKLAIFFDIEGANAIEDRLELIECYYDLGVRWMLMAYNINNRVGGGCQDDDTGLTDFGRAVVREMERVGMLVCCTHVGYRTAHQVLDYAEKPVIFSHSNPRGLIDHPRNIGDDLIRKCADKGGVIGINGVGLFLGNNDISAENVCRHIDYIVQKIGPDHVGLGLDYTFDMQELNDYVRDHPEKFPPELGYAEGINFVPPESLEDIVTTLLGLGYASSHIEAIIGGNFMRLANQVWR